MRPLALALLLLLPSRAAEREECGLVAGERYWVTTEGLVFPDGALLAEWKTCRFPEGVILSVRWDEDPGYAIEAHPACVAAEDEDAQLRALVERARAALAERGIEPSAVPVHPAACAERRRADVVRR